MADHAPKDTDAGAPPGGPQVPPVVVKKYANRRLYNTESSSYITLENLADMVRAGRDFVVYDAKTGDDITRGVLTQIIVEEEGKGHNLLPTNFLRQLIGFYGDHARTRQRTVDGHRDRGGDITGTEAKLRLVKELMDIDWMAWTEANQAIPPAYTGFIGAQLLAHLGAVA